MREDDLVEATAKKIGSMAKPAYRRKESKHKVNFLVFFLSGGGGGGGEWGGGGLISSDIENTSLKIEITETTLGYSI